MPGCGLKCTVSQVESLLEVSSDVKTGSVKSFQVLVDTMIHDGGEPITMADVEGLNSFVYS